MVSITKLLGNNVRYFYFLGIPCTRYIVIVVSFDQKVL